MTQAEARSILEKNGEVIPHFDEEDQKTYAVKIGKFYKEYEESFSFVGYPYTVNPPTPDFAFEYFVDKEDGMVSSTSAPLDKAESLTYWIDDEPSGTDS
jgi:hypothetical protein